MQKAYRMKNAILTTLVMGISSTALQAQDISYSGELNYATVNEVEGAEIGLGIDLIQNGFRLSPKIGAFVYQGELDGFSRETSSICRDLSNGQFSDSENCDATEMVAYGKIEASYSYDKFEFGLGYRASEDTENTYGLLGYRASELTSIRASIGEDYLSVGIVFGR